MARPQAAEQVAELGMMTRGSAAGCRRGRSRGELQARALARAAALPRWEDTQRGLAAAIGVESAGAA